MPPRLNIWPACRALAVRAKPVNQLPPVSTSIAARAQRCFSDNKSDTISRQSPDQLGALNLPAFGQTRVETPATSQEIETPQVDENQAALDYLQLVAYGIHPLDPAVEGHKFGLPELPLPSQKHAKHRYDPIVEQVTKLIMKDGKLGKAHRVSH